ncbi:MAG: ribosome silencing factor [Acidobacteriota bacterium]|nr:ribosome silencing factor [Acidobacteriota bacterium]
MTGSTSNSPTSSPPEPSLSEPLRQVVEAARAKKAEDLIVLDLRASGAFTDHFVICSGRSTRQVTAIVDDIQARLKSLDARPAHLEGYATAEWVLIDCFDFIVHVFTPDTRSFYALERLWGNATRVEV